MNLPIMSYTASYTDHWNSTVSMPEVLTPSVIHSYPASPGYPYTPTLFYRPLSTVGPRPEGFSNVNSVFAGDDLFELSTTDDEEDEDEKEDVKEAPEQDSQLYRYQAQGIDGLEVDGRRSPGCFVLPVNSSAEHEDNEASDDDKQSGKGSEGTREQQSDTSSQDLSIPPLVVSSGTDSDSSQDATMDLATERKTPIIIDIFRADEDEDETMMGDVSDSSDGEDDDDYMEVVATQKKGSVKKKVDRQGSTGGQRKTPARTFGLCLTNMNMIRPPQARYNNTLPITFVLALPPRRPQGLQLRTIPGHMSSYEFSLLIYDFINQMSAQKRFKSIINLDLAVYIRKCLTEGTDESLAGGSFKYWARKMFSLAADPAGNQGDGMEGCYLVHEFRRVALVEEFYGLLTGAHEQTGHGGRDKVMKQIRKTYSYLPKDLVCRFTSACPTCHPEQSLAFFNQQAFKASRDLRTEADFPPATPTPTMKRRRSLEETEEEDEGVAVENAAQARQQRKTDAHKNRQRKAKQTSLTIQVPSGPIVRRDSDSTGSLLSVPPTPMDSFQEDMISCSSISPISEALDTSSASTSAFVTPNLSPILERSDGLPRYRRPHMRVTRSSSKIPFAVDPSLDCLVNNHRTTIIDPSELDHILKGLLSGRGQYDAKQSRQLVQAEVDHIVAITADTTPDHQAAPYNGYPEDSYWRQDHVFDGIALLLGSTRQDSGDQATHTKQQFNQLGLSISMSEGPRQLGATEVSNDCDIGNVTWNKLVLIPPQAITSCSDRDRNFWSTIDSSGLVRHLELPADWQENAASAQSIDPMPLAGSRCLCYLYQTETLTNIRPLQGRSISDIKVTLNGLHLDTNSNVTAHFP